MARRKNDYEEMDNTETMDNQIVMEDDTSDMSSWRERFDGPALEYLEELERTGGDLVRPGKGCVASVELDSIYGYSVFKRRHNKKVFIDLLQNASDGCQTVKLIAYCVIDDAAYFLIKGDRKESAVAFTEFIIREYTLKYNRGLRSVGNPFRKDYVFRVIPNEQLGEELNRIHSLSPNGLAERYPYCSYKYLSSGEHDANLILKIEVDPSRDDFESIIQGMDGMSVPVPKGVENYDDVMKQVDKNFAYQKRFREEDIGFIISEKAARSQTPYYKMAKKLGLEKRHDLVVSTVCSFIDRRHCTYPEAVYALGLNDSLNLRIETIAELNRIHHYSYEYIVNSIVTDGSEGPDRCGDKDGSLLVQLFIELNKAYGYTFEQLCVRFHVTQNLLYLRQLCGL